MKSRIAAGALALALTAPGAQAGPDARLGEACVAPVAEAEDGALLSAEYAEGMFHFVVETPGVDLGAYREVRVALDGAPAAHAGAAYEGTLAFAMTTEAVAAVVGTADLLSVAIEDGVEIGRFDTTGAAAALALLFDCARESYGSGPAPDQFLREGAAGL